MHTLIPLTTDGDGVQAVMGRDLHTFLNIGKDYSTWFKDMCQYGFVAGQDFSPISGNIKGAGRPRTDHVISLDMAKEISMIQRTDRGKQARQYFIECERRVKESVPAIPQTYAEALRAAADNAERAERAELEAAQNAKRLEAAAPKVAKADAHSAVTEWKGRQDFYREVQQWGTMRGLNILHGNIRDLLTRKKMLIGRNRRDTGQIAAQAIKNGWGRNHKGVAENGHAYCTPQISPSGQDIAWKWITEAVDEYGAELNPKKEVA